MTVLDARVAELVSARGHALQVFAFLVCGDDALARDLVQDAIVGVLTRRPRTELVDLERYVKRSIVNASINRHRARARWRLAAPRLAARDSVEDVAASVVEQDRVRRAVGQLPPRQRACIVLFYFDDRPVAEIADMLACSVGSVKRHLADARTFLSGALDGRTALGADHD